MRCNTYLLGLTLLFGVITACTDFDSDQSLTAEQYTTITVTIPGAQTPSTRAIAGASEAAVRTIDLLVFEKIDNNSNETLAQYVKGEIITQSSAGSESYSVEFKASFAKNTNATTLAIIANAADSFTDLVTAIGKAKAAVLKELTFVSNANTPWKTTNSNNFTPIPMYGEYSIPVGGITSSFRNLEDIMLTRMLARIDVVNSDSNFKITNVRVVNYRNAGYIAPAWNTTNGAIITPTPTTPNYPTDIVYHHKGISNAITYTPTNGAIDAGTIYTYEAPASTGTEGNDGHTNAMCLIMQGTFQSKTYYYRIDFTNTEDSAKKLPGQVGFDPSEVGYIPVLRNHLYKFTFSEAGPGYGTAEEALKSLGIMNNLKVSLLVVDESTINNFIFNGKHYLGAEVPDFFSYKAVTGDDNKRLLVATNHPSSWSVGTIVNESDATITWLKAEKQTDLNGKTYIKLTLNANTSTSERFAYIPIKAGLLTHKIKISQSLKVEGIGTLINPGRTYVGAFWRSNQRAERIIRIPVSNTLYKGKWSVRVFEYGNFQKGDILLTSYVLPPEESGVTFITGTEEFKEPDTKGFFVNEDETIVTGNITSVTNSPTYSPDSYIRFRVGLRNTIGENEHRYARLLISYANNTKFQTIYLRQGDSPDYVMHKDDELKINGTRTTRSPKMFSPYNLTAKGLSDTYSNSYITINTDISSSGNRTFTQYPSQAGALFQFAHKVNPRMAYHPTKAPPNNPGFDTKTANYVSFAGDYNTCPYGYTRPILSPTGSSQTGHSLAVNYADGQDDPINAKNCAWGYYADGFFDRLAISTSESGIEYSTVHYGKYTVAYIGGLFFNTVESSTYYNASIFFPACGYRSGISALGSTGNNALYWGSSESTISGKAPKFRYFSGKVDYNNDPVDRFYAFPVRCIKN